MSGRTWAEIIAAVLVVLGSGITSWVTGRAANRATDTTREVGMATLEATREDKFIERLETRLAAVEEESSASAKRVDEQRTVIYRLQDRVVALERAARRDEQLIKDLRNFIGRLLREWPKDGPHPPEPPAGLLDD